MATPTAPTVTLPAQGAPTGPGAGSGPAQQPAPAAPTGPLAAILNPVQPARPAAPIGTTASLPQETPTATGGTKTASPTGQDNTQDGPVGALIRAIATRLGRTGTTTAIKRQHTVTETRATGNQTTNANRTDRSAKSDHSAQHRSNRDAKLADLKNKASQTQDRNNRDVKQAGTTDAKTAATKSDTKAAKNDHASKTGRDSRDSRDVKAHDTKAAKADTASRSSRDDKHHEAKSPAAKTLGGPKTPASEKTNSPGNHTPGGAPRPRTRSSREAGYRDGTRAAAAAGHVKAWRDGTRDGYADRTAANEAERKRMDDAKTRNALRPTGAARPEMAPASGSTVDLAKKDKPAVDLTKTEEATPAAAKPSPTLAATSTPTTQTAAAAVPVQVDSVGERAIHVTADGTPHTMSRAEVRTLKAFERRLAEKRTTLAKIAEGSKDTRATAVDHAARAQRLAEDAKTVKGGAPLVAVLLRLAERAHALRSKTEEIEKTAHRGHEAVGALVANTQTRHGGIYRAVADSPLTSPAEREFYQDKEGS